MEPAAGNRSGEWETRDSTKLVRHRVRNRNAGSWCIHRIDMGTRPQEANENTIEENAGLTYYRWSGSCFNEKDKNVSIVFDETELSVHMYDC